MVLFRIVFLEYFKLYFCGRVFSLVDIFIYLCNRFTVLLKFTVNLKDFSSYRVKDSGLFLDTFFPYQLHILFAYSTL